MELIGKQAVFTPNMSSTPDRKDEFSYEKERTGTVDYVNNEHRYIRVKYEAGKCECHECFKFSQIGADKGVIIRGK